MTLSHPLQAIVASLPLCFFLASDANAIIEANFGFAPTSILAGDPSRATYSLQNSGVDPAENARIAILLPSGMKISGTPNPQNTCGGTVTIGTFGNQDSITLENGTIPAANAGIPGLCNFSVDVTSLVKGSFLAEITSGSLTATSGGNTTSNPSLAQASLTSNMQPISITISSDHSGQTPQGGEEYRRTLKLTHGNKIPLTGLGFSQNLLTIASNLRISDFPDVENTCGGILEFPNGGGATTTALSSNWINLSDAAIPANSSCDISFLMTNRRKVTAAYNSSSAAMKLPVDIITTDQNISNLVSNNFWTAYRTGISSEMTVNNSAFSTILQGESADITFSLKNWNILTTPVMTIPINIPENLEILSTDAGTCGSATIGSGQVLFNVTIPAAPAYDAELSSADCNLNIKVRGVTNGLYEISTATANYSGYSITKTSASLHVNGSLISAEASFDQAEIYFSDSAVFKVILTNLSDTEVMENISLSNAFGTTMPRTTIGERGITSNTCGGLASITGNNRVDFSGGTLPPSGSCEISWHILFGTGSMPSITYVDQVMTNVIGPNDISYRTDSGPQQAWGASSSAAITGTNNITSGISYGPTNVAQGGTTRLTMRVTKFSKEGSGFRDIIYNLNLPTGVVIADQPDFIEDCGGAMILESSPGDTTFRASGGKIALPPGPNSKVCRISVMVKAPLLTEGENIRSVVSTFSTSRAVFSAQDDRVSGEAGYASAHQSWGTTLYIHRVDLPLSIGFSDPFLDGKGSTRLRLTISNSENTTVSLNDLGAMIDLSHAGIRLGISPNPTVTGSSSSTCKGANFNAPASSDHFEFSGLDIAGGATCRIDISITASSGGSHIIIIPAKTLTSLEGASNDDPASATLGVGYKLSIGAGLDPAITTAGMSAQFSIEIINSLSPDGPGNNDRHGQPESLLYPLPSWMTPIGTPVTTCSNASTEITSGQIRLLNGDFPASSTCRISLDVTIATSGKHSGNIPTGTLKTLESITNTEIADFEMTTLLPLEISSTATDSMVRLGTSGTERVTLRNPNTGSLNPTGLSSISFQQSYESPLTGGETISGTCNGSEISLNGAASIAHISGINLDANSSCYIDIPLLSSTAGIHEILSHDFSSAEVAFPSNLEARNDMVFAADPSVTYQVIGAAPDSGIPFRFRIDIENPNEFDLPLMSPAWHIALPSAPSELRVHGASPSLANCGASSLSAANGSAAIQLSGGILPTNSNCAIEIDMIAEKSGTYTMTPLPLDLGYAEISFADIPVTLLGTTSNLATSRATKLLLTSATPQECRDSTATGETSGKFLPGACIEVTISITNPTGEPKSAKDILITETIPTELELAVFHTGNFTTVIQDSAALIADLSLLNPGEAASFSYRAIIR